MPIPKNSLVLLAAVLVAATMARAADKGQADLDKATDLQLKAETLAELKEVADLCEKAIKKGLGKDNTKFAVRLITSSLYQRANRYSSRIFNQRQRITRPQLKDLRGAAMKDLERLLKHNPKYGNALLMVTRLQALPGGDKKRALQAVNEAVKVFKDNTSKQVDALILRSQVSTDAKVQLADLDQAKKLAPKNRRVHIARMQYFFRKQKFDNAATEIYDLIKVEPKREIQYRMMLAELFSTGKKHDKALAEVDQVIKKRPKLAPAHRLRSQINERKGDLKAAVGDLTKAIEGDPSDLQSLWRRGDLHLRNKNYKAARADAKSLLQKSPGAPQAILLRSSIAAAEKKFGEAIRDMQTLIRRAGGAPGAARFRVGLQLQLAFYLSADKRPRRAIKVYDKVLETDESNFLARQARADTALSVGDHKKALADYRILVRQQPKSDAVLNNLAWTLATSPDKALRNGKKAIEYGIKACEVTGYKKPHILSTLAAAYAETGDFKNAIKWSTKAVELQKKNKKRNIGDQLQKELESYKKKKPWRERQNIKENTKPLGGKNLIEA